MKTSGAFAALIVLLSSVTGCVTVGTLVENKSANKVYSGTARHIQSGCSSIVCVDLPLSFVADTAMLPVTVPWTLANFYMTGCSADCSAREGGRK